MGQERWKNELPNSTMSLGDHLEELRARIILAILGLVVGMVVCLVLGKYIIGFIEGPYRDSLADQNMQLQVLGPAEGFTSYMRISLVAGLVVASPWVFYQLWMFVAAGLYPRERRYVYMTIPFSVTLFICGAFFFMFVVAPLCLKFLVKFNEIVLGAKSAFTFQKYVGFVTTLMLVFGLAFQTPIAIFGLNKAGIVSLDVLKRSRKYTLLGIVVIAAVVTPPDVLSQITLAIPLYFLFELGILLCWLSRRKKKTTE